MAANPTPDVVRARVLIFGQVQGVWFRANTQQVARRLELSGWVRNRDSGEVEAVFEGPRDAVEEAVAWCREGPPAARVDFCDVIWESPQGAAPFAILYP